MTTVHDQRRARPTASSSTPAGSARSSSTTTSRVATPRRCTTKATGRRARHQCSFYGIGGRVRHAARTRSRACRLANINFIDFRRLSRHARAAATRGPTDGVIGPDFLQLFTLGLDYGNSRVYLTAERRRPQRDGDQMIARAAAACGGGARSPRAAVHRARRRRAAGRARDSRERARGRALRRRRYRETIVITSSDGTTTTEHRWVRGDDERAADDDGHVPHRERGRERPALAPERERADGDDRDDPGRAVRERIRTTVRARRPVDLRDRDAQRERPRAQGLRRPGDVAHRAPRPHRRERHDRDDVRRRARGRRARVRAPLARRRSGAADDERRARDGVRARRRDAMPTWRARPAGARWWNSPAA